MSKRAWLAMLVASAAALVLVPAAPRAQAWSGAGAPVCTAPGRQYLTRVAADGAGGAFVGWSDQRPGASTSDIYLARIGPDGAPSPGWPADGIAVCTATAAQLLYSMVPDGTGGVYLAWEDYRSGALADIYGQHVLGSGLLAPGWPVDGLGIAAFMEEQRDPKLVPDGAGGVFAVWSDSRTYPFSQRDIYAQHLLANGTPAPGWAANGVPVTNARTYDFGASAAADPDGGLYVTWTRDLANQDIGAQHLDATGAPAPTWPDTGIVLCRATKDQTVSTVVSSPDGGAMAIWKDPRNYSNQNRQTEFYLARFGPDTSLAPGWAQDGRPIYTSINGISAPFAVSDGEGGLLFMWGELVSSSNEDLFVMHADSTGILLTSIAFPDGIVPVCPDTSYQHPVSFVSDGAGGALVGWQDYRADPSFTDPNPYVQHVTAGATIAAGWPATGVALTLEPTAESETIPVAVSGGVIGVWARGAADTTNLFASFVGDDGVVPALVSLVSSEASPGRVRVTWAVAGDAGDAWRIERRGAATDWREIARVWPDGAGRVTVTDKNVLAGARYAYRLTPLAGGAALGETWIEVPLASPAFALRGAWPNPVTSSARVRFALPVAGEATLTLLDAQGRRVRDWRFALPEGTHDLALDGVGQAAAGVYWLRLEQGGRGATVRLSVVR
jgi:hypothetical protein